MIFLSRDAGFQFFFNSLVNKGFRVVHVQEYNKGRHRFVEAVKNDKRVGFYVKYCKDTFHSFNFEFKDFVNEHPEFKGHGESINVEFLSVACLRADYLVFVYDDGRVYFTFPNLIRNFCIKNKLVREQVRGNEYRVEDYSGVKQLVQERTYSFPIILLKNFEELKI